MWYMYFLVSLVVHVRVANICDNVSNHNACETQQSGTFLKIIDVWFPLRVYVGDEGAFAFIVMHPLEFK